MFKNYFKTAWRNIRRNKIFSFINIIGLSIGISASLVIYLLVSYDFSFDKGHRDGDRIYRVVSKIVGASFLQLISLLSADFLKLIGLAFLIAVPIAWWGAHKWLDNFSYRTTLSWWLFFAGGLVMLLVAFVVLLIRTRKATLANPVTSLRSE